MDKIFLNIYENFGGNVLVVIVLVSWLGKIWVNRIRDKDKLAFNNKLEQYKSQLDFVKLTSLKYSEHQFTLYNKLWVSLCDLKIAGDKLWDDLSIEKLLDFVVILDATKIELFKNALLIEDDHYIKLNQLIDKFSNYQIGKIKLMKLTKSNLTDIWQGLETHRITEDNRFIKCEYEKLILIIKDSFRKQIKQVL